MKKIKHPERLYQTYRNMKARCYYPKDKAYKNYGGRGISICKEWLNDSESFYIWALSSGYQDDLTIDRIDVNGNYEPNNCRWITMVEQQSNKRNNINLEINGEIKNIHQWSKELGINEVTIKKRYFEGKNVLEDEHIKVEINGEIKTLIELANESGIPYMNIYQRYYDGWDAKNLINPLKSNEIKLITINGEVHTIKKWTEISGLPKGVILNRISRGWKNEDLLKPKVKKGKRKKYIEINNKSHTVDEWCKIANISPMTFYRRLRKGLKGEELIKPINTKNIS